MIAVMIAWATSTVIVSSLIRSPQICIFIDQLRELMMKNQTLCLITDPISGAWKGGHLRYDFQAFAQAIAGMSMVFDVIVLIFPLPAIRALQMPVRRKIQVAGIFWLGGLYASSFFFWSINKIAKWLTAFEPIAVVSLRRYDSITSMKGNKRFSKAQGTINTRMPLANLFGHISNPVAPLLPPVSQRMGQFSLGTRAWRDG